MSLDYEKVKKIFDDKKDKSYYDIKMFDPIAPKRFDNNTEGKVTSDFSDNIPKPLFRPGDFKVINNPVQERKKELIDKIYDYTAALKNPNIRYKEAMKKIGRGNIFEQGNVPVKYIISIRERMEDRQKFLIKRRKKQERVDKIENLKTEIRNFKLKSLKPKIVNIFVKYFLNNILILCNSVFDYFYFLKTVALLPSEKRQLFKGIRPHPSNTLFVLAVKKGINISSIKEIDNELRKIEKRQKEWIGPGTSGWYPGF